MLPASHKLWIKEHRAGIGDRSFAWYRKIRALPNVRLIGPFEDTYRLIKGADLVVTIAGTVGYEAALMGVPTVGLSAVFFSSLLGNRPGERNHPLEWQMQRLLAPQAPPSGTADERRRKSVDFLAHLHANSWPGNPYDTEMSAAQRSDPNHMALETEGFRQLLRSLREAKGRPT